MMESKEWVLSSYLTDGIPTSDHLKLRRNLVDFWADPVPEGCVAVEVLWLSVDPYLRSRMTGKLDGLYTPQFELQKAITAFGIARVVNSGDPEYNSGDVIIVPYLAVSERCVVPTASISGRIDSDSDVSIPEHLNTLGVPGFTAWVGINIIGEAKSGESVFVSAAAGAVGMMAGQLAKLKGCRVVGSAGTDDKVKMLKNECKFDDAFNYRKETDLDAALAKYFPSGIDIYLDNVGGEMLEAVLNHVNVKARIPLCGMISQYNKIWTDRYGIKNLLNVVGKEVRMEGFMCLSYINRWGEFTEEIKQYMKEGKLFSKLKVYNGIESFLEGLASVFSSSNIGKVVIKVN